ncbi:MAG: acmD [Chloroflexi bacterium]|nr:acmD [Chloroflexota bacterium]
MQILSVPSHAPLVRDRAAAVELIQIANDPLVEAAHAHPSKFRALLAMPLQFPDAAVQELDRLAGRPEVVGTIVVGSAGGRQLNDPEILPLFAELERRNLPFLLHPISPPGLDCMLELNLANVVGFMFESASEAEAIGGTNAARLLGIPIETGT